jgi:PIN domain nuclease of toxin-antitoxin system
VLAEKGRLELEPDPVSWVRRALEQDDIKEAPINIEVAVRSSELDLPHQDPADRFLAATAIVYGLELATVDSVLLKTDWLPTIPYLEP